MTPDIVESTVSEPIGNRAIRRATAAMERRGIDRDPNVVLSEILTTQEAAAYCRLSKPTMERLRLSGEGSRYLKIGSAVRYRVSDLQEWLNSRLVSSTSEAA